MFSLEGLYYFSLSLIQGLALLSREKDDLEQDFRFAWEDFRSSITEKV
jgi:hypothetical protein